MSASDHETRHYVTTYLNVFAALLVLTTVTVAASYLRLAVPLAVALALVIATLQGSLVAGVFMHLIREQRAIVASLLITLIFFAALLALPLLAERDSIATAYSPWTALHTAH